MYSYSERAWRQRTGVVFLLKRAAFRDRVSRLHSVDRDEAERSARAAGLVLPEGRELDELMSPSRSTDGPDRPGRSPLDELFDESATGVRYFMSPSVIGFDFPGMFAVSGDQAVFYRADIDQWLVTCSAITDAFYVDAETGDHLINEVGPDAFDAAARATGTTAPDGTQIRNRDVLVGRAAPPTGPLRIDTVDAALRHYAAVTSAYRFVTATEFDEGFLLMPSFSAEQLCHGPVIGSGATIVDRSTGTIATHGSVQPGNRWAELHTQARRAGQFIGQQEWPWTPDYVESLVRFVRAESTYRQFEVFPIVGTIFILIPKPSGDEVDPPGVSYVADGATMRIWQYDGPGAYDYLTERVLGRISATLFYPMLRSPS